MVNSLHYTRLIPGISLTGEQVQAFFDRLSTAETPRPLVFETHAVDTDVRYFIGRSDSGKSPVRSLIRSHLADSRTMKSARPAIPERVARLKATPRTAPLAADTVGATLNAVYGVLASRRKGEHIAIQVVLGQGRRPAQVPAKIADPGASIPQLVLRGDLPAPTEARRRIAAHAASPRIDTTIRIGVSDAVPARRRQLRGQLLGALAQLEAPNVRLSLVDESPTKWEHAKASWRGIPLTGAQLGAVACWPVDELELPGLPPQHPRLLPPPKGITTTAAVFATATAPGIETRIGMAPADRLQHVSISGGTGSGKSQVFAALALEDIAASRPLVLVEPKRQLVDHIVARAPKEAAGRIVVIDAAETNPVGFNPLDIGDRDPGPVVDGILEVFKFVFADGWGPRTEDLLHVTLHTLVANGQRRGVPHTLLDLVPLISDDGYRRTVIGAVANDATLAGYWATFDNLTPAHRASIVAAPLNKLRKFVLRKNVAAILGQAQPRLRLRDVFRDPVPKAILVPLNDALIGPGSAQLLGGLIVSEIWLATQERALERDPQSRPGMVLIDEMQRYLHLPTAIDDALATSRSYGVAWHLAFQGRAQIPASLALAIELNARNQITFAASPHDATALVKTTAKLTKEDFQSLDRFHIYANLVVNGAPAGWFSARTLPPVKPTGFEQQIRDAYRERFAGDAAEPVSTASQEPTPAAAASSSSEQPATSHRRKRRAS